MGRKAVVECRHCGSQMIRADKYKVSNDNSCYHVKYRCTNVDCGYTEKWQEKVMYGLSPPAEHNPEVKIPMSPYKTSQTA